MQVDNIKNDVPMRIRYADMDKLPKRDDYCDIKPIEGVQTFMPVSYSDSSDYINNEQVYRPCIFGYLRDGRKACVKITDPALYLDIAMMDGDFVYMITAMLKAAKIDVYKTEVINAKPLKYFTLNTHKYYRLWYKNSWARINTIKQIDQLNSSRKARGLPLIQTATDDNDWFLIYLRENKVYGANWNDVSNYTVEYGKCITLVTPQANIVKSKCNDKPRLLNCRWDIETHRTIQNGEVPRRVDSDWSVICVNLGYYWGDSKIPFCNISISSVDSDIRPGLGVVIQCDGQAELTTAFAKCFSIMQPDTIAAFNGGCFDWPIMLGAIENHMGFVEFKRYASMIPPYASETNGASEKRHVSNKNTKISADTSHNSEAVLSLPGLLDLDCMVIFMKLYSKAEVAKGNSLNFYLKENKLPPKEDLPYKLMFKIYELALEAKRNDYSNWATRVQAMREEFSRLMGEIMPVEPTTDAERKQAVDKMMAEVLYYCKVDADGVHQLLVARNVMGDAMEFANTSYTRMYDSIHHADGMRVLNYIGHYVKKDGGVFSNRTLHIEDCDKDWYPGGYVDDPVCGLIDAAVVGLDFTSLYPNVIMANNYSPDRLVIDVNVANDLKSKGYTLQEVTVKYKKHSKDCKCHPDILETTGWFVSHRGAQSQSDKVIEYYRKIISYADTVTKQTVSFAIDMKPTGELIQPGKTKQVLMPFDRIVRNVNEEHLYMSAEDAAKLATFVNPKRSIKYEEVRGRDALPGEYAGIFPRVVNKLFNKRVPLKHELIRLMKLRERIAKGEPVDTDMTLEQIDYEIVKLDSKQKAVKVIANTTYGKSGEVRSPIYMLLVAGAITLGGQKNVKTVHGYVENAGCPVYYGDTDSVYASVPAKYTDGIIKTYLDRADELTKQRDDGKISSAEYIKLIGDARVWKHTERTKITMTVMNKLAEELGDLLLMDNGTRRLTLAYEEVLDKAYICGKKKYFGRAHVATINFDNNPATRFVRGIDIVKQGQSEVSKMLGYEFIDTILDVRVETNPSTLIGELSRKFYLTEWPLDTYVLSAKYKPQKKNVAVLNFVKRMRSLSENYMKQGNMEKAALYRAPEPGDKFQYVIVKRAVEYDIRGRKVKFGKGDVMEYKRVFESTQAYEIDMDYYMDRQIAGVFARFNSYKYTNIVDDDPKIQDKLRIKASKKDIMKQCNDISGLDKSVQRAVGARNRKVYKTVMKKMSDVDSALSTSAQEYIYADYSEDNTMVSQLVNMASTVDNVECMKFAQTQYDLLIQRMKLPDIVKLISNKINGRALFAKRAYTRYIKDTHQKMYDLAPAAVKSMENRDSAIEFMVTNERDGIQSTAANVDMKPLIEFDKVAQQYRVYKRMDAELDALCSIIDKNRSDAIAIASSRVISNARSISRETTIKNNLIEDYIFK